MALTANYVPKYKGIVSSHPQLENSSIYDDGEITTTKGRKLGVTVQTTTYVVEDTVDVVVCNATTEFTVTLPAASGSGRRVQIKSINTGAISIAADGSDTMDGSTSQRVIGKFGCIRLVDYAANKWILLY
jgi:hypothetical protein